MSEPLSPQQQKKRSEQHLAQGRGNIATTSEFKWPWRVIVVSALFSAITGFLVAQQGLARGLVMGGACLVGYSMGRLIVFVVQKIVRSKRTV